MPAKYDRSSLKIWDDPVAIIRHRPRVYVGSDDAQPGWLATLLAHSALGLGCQHVEIHHVDEWWTVASEEDWLTYHNKLAVRETFNRILPARAGAYACRYEVVVRALAASTFTCKADELVVLSGDECAIRRLLAREPLSRRGEKRVVAFTMTSSNTPAEAPNGQAE